jgi:hypothetical protein
MSVRDMLLMGPNEGAPREGDDDDDLAAVASARASKEKR